MSGQGDRLMSNKKCKLPEGSRRQPGRRTAVPSKPGSESSLRDCENQLTVLFDYQSSSLITSLPKNPTLSSGERRGSDAGKEGRLDTP